MGERTGSRVFQWVWSYVVVGEAEDAQLERKGGHSAPPSQPPIPR
ncbi:hypothetical protein CLIM01_03646 [Colletotrichum limetticola]|uniref:Uncharacterized protein n=1 Tax=Colletotrichum limetticola TaxID=1209924 RepID=A0ABQ9Q5C0_9PEZI|nr:hypothetical protein CLIM01_03646 [Colletotrichum limetticola]